MRSDLLLLVLLIFIFGIVIGATVSLGNDDIITPINNTLECNQDQVLTAINSLLNTTYENDASLYRAIQSKNMYCAPTYSIELPEDRDPIQQALELVRDVKDYELGAYDCTEKSQLLAKLLSEMGYSKAGTQLVHIDCEAWHYGTGYTKEDCEANNLHEITCINGLKGVCYEATGGFRWTPEDMETMFGIKQ